ncbi:MAG: DNA cytosine methyltransferase [Candidatus Gastranaerophilales bacterium]|nr:DNA cytosine methyltransferase [Candidatus Gastranaerophilales bacterium]
MKILNLYAGLGGNRKLWGDKYDITSVEINQQIADIYKDLYPEDTIIVGDAHEYLLRHFREFDFIWASPPCQTHSRATLGNINKECFDYPDMKLYQEIILLKTLFKGDWVIENVRPYYKPLIAPSFKINRHLFWSNRFLMTPGFEVQLTEIWESVKKMENYYGFNLESYKLETKFRRKILRNCVTPEIGKYIFEQIVGGISEH